MKEGNPMEDAIVFNDYNSTLFEPSIVCLDMKCLADPFSVKCCLKLFCHFFFVGLCDISVIA